MDINTLIRYALAWGSTGARILGYVFITALLFTFFTIGASFGHLMIAPLGNVHVWKVLVALVVVVGGAIGWSWREFRMGWFINMVGLVLVALTGLNPTFRLLGPCVGALYVLASMLLIGGAASTGTIFGYGIAPGEATITNAPSGKVFGIVMLVSFWLVLTVLGIGIATPFTEPLYVVGILGLAVLVIPGTLYLGIGKTTTRYALGIASALLIVMVAAAVLDSLHTLGVLSQSPAKALWKGATGPDACTQERDVSKKKIINDLQNNEEWRVKNALWLQAGSALAKEYFAKYESGQAGLNAKLRSADEAYERCKGGFIARTVATSTVPSLTEPPSGWLHAILYEWHWAISIFVFPTILAFLLTIFTLGKILKSETAREYAKGLAFLWAILVMVLRAAT